MHFNLLAPCLDAHLRRPGNFLAVPFRLIKLSTVRTGNNLESIDRYGAVPVTGDDFFALTGSMLQRKHLRQLTRSRLEDCRDDGHLRRDDGRDTPGD